MLRVLLSPCATCMFSWRNATFPASTIGSFLPKHRTFICPEPASDRVLAAVSAQGKDMWHAACADHTSSTAVRVKFAIAHSCTFTILDLPTRALDSFAIEVLQLTSRCTYMLSKVHMSLAELLAEFSMTNTWPDNTVESYYQYKPSLALSLVALVLFFGIATVIAIQTYKYRPRCRFMWIVVFTGGLEVAGYISHIIAAQTVNNSAYVSYLVFTILAPNFLALANYIAVGRVAEQLQLSGRFLNAKSIAAAFFIIDLICIGIQGAGSAILSSSLDNNGAASTSGETVVLIGLAIQLFFFSSFTLVAGKMLTETLS